MHDQAALKSISVMVLDDDDFILDVTQAVLAGIGVGHIATYTSASPALAVLDMYNPRQVVVCDLNMPEIDGIEVIRHLGQNAFAGSVIVLSGEDSRTLQTVASIGHAYHLRLLGVLAKPVDPPKLLRLLQESLDPDAPLAADITRQT